MEHQQEDPDEQATRAREVHLTMDLCLRIGEMMRSVADHFGLRTAEIDVTFTALSMGHQRSPDDVPMLMMRHVQQRDIDYEDLTAVDHLVRDILTDQADLFLARSRMATIVSLGHAFPRWAVTFAAGGRKGSATIWSEAMFASRCVKPGWRIRTSGAFAERSRSSTTFW